jgi:ribose transport system substrate-binding protein
MPQRKRFESSDRRFLSIRTLFWLGTLASLMSQGCGTDTRDTIAFIPRTTGSLLWEPAHSGAESAAQALGSQIYWNAATREDDVEGQISLIERVIHGEYEGLVIAPSNALALISPVREALTRRIPTVIIGSPLSLPAGDGLYYVLNDEEAGGRIAAQRVGLLLHGSGSIIVLGIDPAIKGIIIRARSFERSLSENYPNIRVVDSRAGSFSRQHEQQITDDILTRGVALDAVVALNWTSAFAALTTLENHPSDHSTKVIAFDPESLPFAAKSLDSIVMQDTRGMGDRAVRLIDSYRKGLPVPGVTMFPPVLVTRTNLASQQVRRLTAMDWQPGPPVKVR